MSSTQLVVFRFIARRDVPFLLDSLLPPFIFHKISPTDLIPSPAPKFKTFKVISDLFSEVSRFQRHTALHSKRNI
jgi:hypothetical protein